MKNRIVVGLLLLTAIMMLLGCGGADATETVAPEDIPIVVSSSVGQISAEGVVEPARWSDLHAENGGPVVEVLVEEGDRVSQGDALVRIDAADAEIAVQRAEAELAMAQAKWTQAQSGPRPEDLAVTEARLAAAQAALAQAAAQRDKLVAGEAQKEIAAAQAALAAAQAEEKQIYNAHEQTMECFTYTLPDGEEKEICPGLGRPEEYTRLAMHTAQERLDAARLQLEAAQNAASAQVRDAQAGVWASTAQESVVQAQLELQKAGSTAEQIAAAEAGVERAEIALASAQAALERTVIRAPFDGVVAEVYVNAGDVVVAGQPLVNVATLDELRIRTKDLRELDVLQVAIGQTALVRVEALSNARIPGRVMRIDPQAEDYRGDVVYPVIVDLDEETSDLRWGMTVMVDIDVD
ncbi:MAG TPA: HlyD family efflux transporter periplasmic adaptor subunit [Chloroflexi bacterium]|nr:HlyD family efflux transporter periplasmic adaptor subunit [Chloroflexota bacterium]